MLKIINIVHVDVHFDDGRKITAVDIKLKSIADEGKARLTGHMFTATCSAAFFKTTLLHDAGVALEIKPNPSRDDIVNFYVSFKDDNELTIIDVGNFVYAFQAAIDSTDLF